MTIVSASVNPFEGKDGVLKPGVDKYVRVDGRTIMAHWRARGRSHTAA